MVNERWWWRDATTFELKRVRFSILELMLMTDLFNKYEKTFETTTKVIVSIFALFVSLCVCFVALRIEMWGLRRGICCYLYGKGEDGLFSRFVSFLGAFLARYWLFFDTIRLVLVSCYFCKFYIKI
jgi:hypothetical protein